MNKQLITALSAAAMVTLMLTAVGCDREVSKKTSTSVKSDGTVKQQETTVTEHPDGSVTKEETKTKSTR